VGGAKSVGFSRVPSQSQILGTDPALGQEDLKSLTSYICMNICEYFINVCAKEREREREFVCMCVYKNRLLRVYVFVFHNIVKLLVCVRKQVFACFIFKFNIIMKF
jgi:hypothetical protein